MARLLLMYHCLRQARAQDMKILRNKRRMMRRGDKAFTLTDEEFLSHYRVSKELFDEIFEYIRPYMHAQRRVSEISPKYKTLVALSFFANGSYQKSVGGTYGTPMSQQSVSRAIRDVTEALNNASVVQKHIRFPQTLVERNIIKRRFYEKFNIPAVVGCIDGTHIAIIKPHENEQQFLNRKNSHSRNVQIICDADLIILSVDASFGGATHETVIWNHHPIKTYLSELVSNEENAYFLGDSAYPQREYMMTPIVDAVPGSPEAYYNRLHGTAHKTIERTIDVLKNRWRCLLGHRVLHYHPDVASKIIIACCVLHNICNRNQLTQNVDAHTLEADEIEQPVVEENAELQRGLQKRYELVQYLWEVANRRN